MRFQRRLIARTFLIFAMAILSSYCAGQTLSPPTATPVAAFPPLEQWKAAVISGNVAALQALYSSNPPAQLATAAGGSTVTSEVAFWTGLKARRIKLSVIQSESPQPDVQQVVFQAEIHTSVSPGGQTFYVTEGQLWQKQAETWRVAGAKRSDATKLQQPASTSKVIYAPGVDAHAEIKHALELAAKGHKRVLVVFGANWCYDCHVLDLAFYRSDVAGLLQQNFEVVHVDVGEGDKNQDLMAEYQVPMKRGIPAIAVLDGNGKLLYSQKGGEFEKARALAPEDVLQFLNKWRPVAR
ncbi:MAG TPA: thioredoxin family protein [Terriglobales bacterium]|jgi:thioredoxin 1